MNMNLDAERPENYHSLTHMSCIRQWFDNWEKIALACLHGTVQWAHSCDKRRTIGDVGNSSVYNQDCCLGKPDVRAHVISRQRQVQACKAGLMLESSHTEGSSLLQKDPHLRMETVCYEKNEKKSTFEDRNSLLQREQRDPHLRMETVCDKENDK